MSVVSDSVWPHRQQPTRLLRPRDFPGKSTGVGCHCLLQECWYNTTNKNTDFIWICCLPHWCPLFCLRSPPSVPHAFSLHIFTDSFNLRQSFHLVFSLAFTVWRVLVTCLITHISVLPWLMLSLDKTWVMNLIWFLFFCCCWPYFPLWVFSVISRVVYMCTSLYWTCQVFGELFLMWLLRP